MSYRFKRKESVSKAVRRLGRERIEHALGCLKDCERTEAIHSTRKDIKKVRAVLRLVRTRIAKKEFGRLAGMLREAAAHLMASRDAFIKTQTLRDVAGHFKKQLTPGALSHVQVELRKNSDEQLQRFGKEKTRRAVERILRRAAKTLDQLNVKEAEWKALDPGVKAAYRGGRRAYRTVLSDPLAENFHEWRKRVKDLWYHAHLLEPIWPEQITAMGNELEALGQFWGDDHDLVVLRQDVEARFGGDSSRARELEILNGLIEQRQHELRAASLALGARFYAERPSAFCDRLAGY